MLAPIAKPFFNLAKLIKSLIAESFFTKMFYLAQIYLSCRKGIEQFLDGLTLRQKAEIRIQSNLVEKAFDNEKPTSTFLVC